MKKNITILFILLLLASHTVVLGQQEADSLALYMRLAAKNSPVVQQSFDAYRAALEKAPQAGTLSDPELNLDFFLSPMELTSGRQVGSISLMQMFPWFGTLRAAKDEMSLMAMAEYESFRATKLQVFNDVETTWYSLYGVQQEINISLKGLELLHTLERLSLARFRGGDSGTAAAAMSPATPAAAGSTQPAAAGGMNGMGGAGQTAAASSPAASSSSGGQMSSAQGATGLADIYRIRMATGELENNIATLRSRQQTLTVTLNSMTGRPPLTPVAVPDSLGAELLPLTPEALHDSIMARNPMKRMNDYERQSLSARGRMVNAMGYPMVGLGVSYSLISASPMSTSSMNGKDMIMPMVKITLPLYRRKYNAMKRETGFLESSSAYAGESVTNTLEVEYYTALQQYQDAVRSMRLYEEQLQLADRTLSVMLKSFAVSGTNLTDIIQVQQQVLDYRLRHAEAVTAGNTAAAKLRQLMASEPLL